MNTDADADWTPKKMTARLRINLKNHHTKHALAPPEYGAPLMPVCKLMQAPMGARVRGTNCPACLSRVKRPARIKPWDAYAHKSTEHFMNTYQRSESGMVLVFWYGDPSPARVWDIKTQKRLK